MWMHYVLVYRGIKQHHASRLYVDSADSDYVIPTSVA